MVAFALIIIAAAVAMLRGRKNTTASDTRRHLALLKITALGVGVGAASGSSAPAGAFCWFPRSRCWVACRPAAVGTSLVVIAMQSFAGLAGHLATEHIDWRLAAMVLGAAVVGALVGGRLIVLVDPNALRKLFGWFVLLMASVILAEETSPAIGAAAAGLTLVGAGFYLACTRTAHCPLRRLATRSRVGAAAT